MAIHAAPRRVTHYKYNRPISLGPQVVRLRPASHCRTPMPSYSLKITPGGHSINRQQDPRSNHLARLVFPEKTTEFRVEVDLAAEMAVYTFPVNSYEVESRRLARFFVQGHTLGELVVPDEETNREFPMTLDLRA